MSCMPQNFSSIFDHSGREMSFVFHTHGLTNILRKRLILQQGVERDWICSWIHVVHFIIIEQRCTSCFPAFARLKGRIKSASPSFLGQERFHHSTSRMSSFGQTVCQHRRGIDPVNASIGDGTLFLDSTYLFACSRASQSKLW